MRDYVLRTSALMRASSALAIAAVSTFASAGTAEAAGFALREQSTEYQGMSFAGNAAGTSISSMFWNSAAAANKDGLNMESSYTLIAPNSEVTTTSVNTSGFESGLGVNFGGVLNNAAAKSFAGASNDSGNIAQGALLGASYGTYQVSKDLFIGMAVNTPFGLTTKPENENYDGSILARTTTLKTFNANPTLAYRVSPGISIGVGVQIQYGDGRFRFASGTPTPLAAVAGTGDSTTVDGTGWAFGGTAGITLEPASGTRIGVGYRSRLTQEINGKRQNETTSIDTEVDVELPDIVTVSLQQVLTPSMRLSATFEWSNWSRFTDLTVRRADNGAVTEKLDFNWSDGYFFSAGLEYDAMKDVTVRGGVAYEISPVDSPEKRSPGLPDADRVWLSGGLTWAYSASTSIDFAYSHIFVEDSSFSRASTVGVVVNGDIESSVDLISVGVKTKW